MVPLVGSTILASFSFLKTSPSETKLLFSILACPELKTIGTPEDDPDSPGGPCGPCSPCDPCGPAGPVNVNKSKLEPSVHCRIEPSMKQLVPSSPEGPCGPI